ncbi:TadE/TadG family type IV pilus assembly protein [Micromonospora aurantiaca (nom. illeg.)]|uniref:TadE/TadG family type IV pilus assembly protein n=1 Tax=Micromonospora aurantiaca (nom. illeg.) TaxID=47850 RepID=UPI0033FE7D63
MLATDDRGAPSSPAPRWHGQLGARLRRDDGSAAVEFMIVAPVVLALLFLAIQIAEYSYARSIALTAAQSGVSAGRAYTGSPGDARIAAEGFIARAAGGSLFNTNVQVASGPEQITVTVTGNSPSLVPGISGWTVRQTATGPVERFTREVR